MMNFRGLFEEINPHNIITLMVLMFWFVSRRPGPSHSDPQEVQARGHLLNEPVNSARRSVFTWYI